MAAFDDGKSTLVESTECQKDEFIGLKILVKKHEGQENSIVG